MPIGRDVIVNTDGPESIGATAPREPSGPDMQRMRVLGVPINLLNLEIATVAIIAWANNKRPNYVCVRDVHGVMHAQKDSEFRRIHEDAAMVTPDGMPLVWIGRARAGRSVGRVCGSDLVDALCAASVTRQLSHYFYGGKPGVAKKMADTLQARYPGLDVAGVLSPPMGDISPEKDSRIVETINRATPDIVWVGLSSPRQEYWMRDHVGRIRGATLIGIGAAFDFQAGTIARAPTWMQRAGLEWLHRLCCEPRRLWRRYLILAPKFIVLFVREQVSRSNGEGN